ncbi:hydrogen dehydrogenase [Treponema primitia ZAS-2]|uniref:HndA3 n=1 Tax=Treponema primitia (strain ATCC BAA-887 / DSM 12427 / ZAS-2) TaxID=545694 RepID=F5YKB5_TREPZ|nr:[FeFe] hydrogenase, group A [Treponema primitia]AEF85721.1 hydrogen dehydrogenase [Treponema primitia ZAS-2]AEL20826.1 HndA3 [Treponema primitia ZAS-2]
MADKQFITIDGVPVEMERGLNVLEHAKKAGIQIPAFCYTPELSIYGACRMCLVEIVDPRTGRSSLDSSCSLLPKAGMVIKTNTAKLRGYRKNILELLLANHCRDCTTCDNSTDCKLQAFAVRFGITGVRYPQHNPEPKLDESSLCITKDTSKCIQCGCCIRMCNEIQHVGAIDFAHRGSEMAVACVGEKDIASSVCVGCGQCAAVCPTGALTVKNETKRVWKLLDDKNAKVSVQIAPAVRVAVGNAFGIPPEQNTFGRLVAALRRIGFDEVYDTNVAADMTIIQEAAELLERLKTPQTWPLFTSCCPAWIQFVEKHHPEVMPHVSTTRSPMQLFSGTYTKEGQQFYRGAIMPCTAKKFESSRPEFQKDGKKLVEFALTSQEVIRMIKESGIDYANIEPEAVEGKWGNTTGAAVIFGVSGGVMEAALRYALSVLKLDTPENYIALAESGIRGLPRPDAKAGTLVDGVKTATIKLGDIELKVAVVSGLANADEIIQRVKDGEHFDFVEVMACPGGCIGGGGQPPASWEVKAERAHGLYLADKEYPLNSVEKNPVMKEWEDLVGNEHAQHEYWHIHYAGHGHK